MSASIPASTARKAGPNGVVEPRSVTPRGFAGSLLWRAHKANPASRHGLLNPARDRPCLLHLVPVLQSEQFEIRDLCIAARARIRVRVSSQG